MANPKVIIYKNDKSEKALNNFKKAFPGVEVDEALLAKFKQAEGAYVVEGRFDSKYVSLDTKIARELWKGKAIENEYRSNLSDYNNNYLIIVKPDASSNFEDATFIVPAEGMKELVVVRNDHIVTKIRRVRGAVMNYSSTNFIAGDVGNDIIYAGNLGSGCKAFGREGHDVLTSSSNHDWLDGGSGDDLLSGNAGNDWLFGNKGNDKLSGGVGNNWLFGGEGEDTYVIQEGTNIIVDNGGWVELNSNAYSPKTLTVTKDGSDLIVSGKKNLENSHNVRILDFFQNKDSFTFATAGKKYELSETNGQYKLMLATK